MIIYLLTTLKVIITFFGDIFYLSSSFFIFYFFLNVKLQSIVLVEDFKIKIIPYQNFFFIIIFNWVGVIEIFLVCLVGELCFSGKRV